jgi:hypothetical protein
LDYPEPSNGKHLTAREGIYGVGQTRLPDDHYGSAFKWNVGEETGPKLEAGGGVANKAVSTSQTNGSSLKRGIANGETDPAAGKRVKVVA